MRVPLSFEILLGNEPQCRRVDVVPQACGIGAAREYVSEMRVGIRAPHLDMFHKMAPVRSFDDVLRFDGPEKARPIGSGIELVTRTEEGLTRYDIHVYPLSLVVPVRILKRRLCTAMLCHLILQRRQLRTSSGFCYAPLSCIAPSLGSLPHILSMNWSRPEVSR